MVPSFVLQTGPIMLTYLISLPAAILSNKTPENSEIFMGRYETVLTIFPLKVFPVVKDSAGFEMVLSDEPESSNTIFAVIIPLTVFAKGAPIKAFHCFASFTE